MSDIGKDATGDRAPQRAGRSKLRVDAAHSASDGKQVSVPSFVDLPARRRMAAENCRQHLLSQQAGDGMWHGHAGNGVAATARYVLLQHWIDRGEDPTVATAVQSLEEWELPNGGWAGSPVCESDGSAESPSVANQRFDLDASVMAYLAIRMHRNGRQQTDAVLDRARDAIVAGGGLNGCDGLSRFWLAVFGLVDYSECPTIVPEAFRYPAYFSDQPQRSGHWVRAVHVPLSILASHRPVKPLPVGVSLADLNLSGARARLTRLPKGGGELGASGGLFNAALRGFDRLGLRPWRRSALASTEQWIFDHASADDGLAGSWDGTMLAVIALISRGMSRHDAPISELLLALQQAMVPGSADSKSLGLPAFQSPTTDTALGIRAMTGVDREEISSESRSAVEWLLSREIADEGEWAVEVTTEPSGWCREFSNRRFANVPTTAMVLLALRQQFSENPPSSLVTDDSMVAMIRANSLNLAHRQIAVLDRVAAASRRGRRWLLALQNTDGGWGHSQKVDTAGRLFSLRQNSASQGLLDTSTAASTGRVLQSLGAWEMACGQTSVDNAVSWLRRTQTSDGAWPEQHDASSFEATCSVVAGLRAVGLPRRDTSLQSAAEWCLSRQRADGGWRCEAESPVDSDQRASDPLSTAWALLALVAAGHRDADAAKRGLAWLLEAQQANGSWPFVVEAEPIKRDENRAGRVKMLSFRTSVTVNAYAMLAINAFEPFRSSRMVKGPSSAGRNRSK